MSNTLEAIARLEAERAALYTSEREPFAPSIAPRLAQIEVQLALLWRLRRQERAGEPQNLEREAAA